MSESNYGNVSFNAPAVERTDPRHSVKSAKLVPDTDTLENLKAQDRALFIALENLNDSDMQKVQALLDSLDSEPIFIAADGATCG